MSELVFSLLVENALPELGLALAPVWDAAALRVQNFPIAGADLSSMKNLLDNLLLQRNPLVGLVFLHHLAHGVISRLHLLLLLVFAKYALQRVDLPFFQLRLLSVHSLQVLVEHLGGQMIEVHLLQKVVH